MFRFYFCLILNFYYVIIFLYNMKRYIVNPKYSKEFRYNYAQHIARIITRRARVTVFTSGQDKLPKENGFICYANHQGKFDALSIVQTIDNPISIVIDKSVCNNPLLNNFLELTYSKKLDKTNAREAITLFKTIGEEIKDGCNYVIFPEGGYDNNKNHLQKFFTGCLRFLHDVKCPIVPTCLYDTYKVFSGETGRSFCKVICQVHYLDPIYYDEYKDLNKNEIADLVKDRIQAKIEEIDAGNINK